MYWITPVFFDVSRGVPWTAGVRRKVRNKSLHGLCGGQRSQSPYKMHHNPFRSLQCAAW
jgi:hypothetical protein